MSGILRPLRRKSAGAALALALLAACSTTGGDSAKDTTAPSATSAATTAPGETTTTEAGPPADLYLGFDLSSGDINATRQKYGVGGQNSNLLNEDYYVALMDAYNADGSGRAHV